MPIQLTIWERRDGGSRETIANTILEVCRIFRKEKGITSSRFYWSGTEAIVHLTEGETAALNNRGQSSPVDATRLTFTLADNARQTLSIRLMEPRASAETYRSAGR